MDDTERKLADDLKARLERVAASGQPLTEAILQAALPDGYTVTRDGAHTFSISPPLEPIEITVWVTA